MTQQEFMRKWIQAGHTPAVLTIENPRSEGWNIWYEGGRRVPSPYRTFIEWFHAGRWPEYDVACWN